MNVFVCVLCSYAYTLFYDWKKYNNFFFCAMRNYNFTKPIIIIYRRLPYNDDDVYYYCYIKGERERESRRKKNEMMSFQ